MKILVFSQYFYPENFRINTLCRDLVERGHEVTVLTGYPQYPIGRIYDGYGFDIPYEREWKGVRIERVPVHARGKTPFGMLRNCVDYVREANRWVRNCTEKFDVVYVFEVSPVTVGLPAVTYKEKFGVPMFFNLQDLWPENVEEVLGIRFPPLSWYINKIVDRIYAGSDKILCTSRGFVKNLTQRGVPEEKLVFWPQFCLEPDLSGKEKPEVYSDDTFNIVFAGNLGDAQGLDLMVEAAGQLRGSGIRWYLVGDGRAKERLQKMVADSGLEEDVVFVGRGSEDEANRYVHFADCAYLSFKNNKIFNMMIPAKLQTYLACGTPVLAAAGGETAQLITSSGCGIVAEQECAALAAAAREAAAMSKEQRSEMAAAARKYYDGNFVMDTLVEELLELMENETKKQE